MIKKILIVLGIILLGFAGLIGYSLYKDFQQEEILEQEVLRLSNSDLVKDNFTISIKTKGEYAYVESAIKNFYKTLSDNVKLINKYMDDKRFINILTVQNIQDDRPEFINSNMLLSNTKTEVTKALDVISSLCEEENIKNLLNEEKVSDYTIDYYRKLMYTKKDLKYFAEVKEQMQTLSVDLNMFLDKVKEILDFLEKNNDSWFIENDQLYFENSTLVDRYNGLYGELKKIVIEKFNGSDDGEDDVQQSDSSI